MISNMAEPKYKKEQFLKVEKNDNLTFWYTVVDKKGNTSYKIDRRNLRLWLESSGIRKLYTTNKDFIIVRSQNNIVDFIDIASIKLLALHHVEKHNEMLLTQTFEKGIGQYIKPVDMDIIKVMEKEFFGGEKNTAYFFYKNIIGVERNNETLTMKYKDFTNLIWRSAIMKNNYPDESKLKDSKPGEWEQFFNNVTEPGEERKYIRCVLGYALHKYRNRANMRAIIINDDNTNGEAKGGTGKGIIAQALGHFENQVIENGKAYRANRPFSFQNLDVDTGQVVIDDPPRGFTLEPFYSVITDGLYIEKKNKQPIRINPENAPLFIFTTNHGIAGSDESDQRRRYDIALKKHYGRSFTPEDDFGHLLFSWQPNSTEWIKFDLFMLECANMYMTNGVPYFENNRIKEKQLAANTHSEFPGYADTIKIGEDISRPETLDQLRIETGDKNLKQARVTRWIKIYSKYNNLKYSDNRVNKTFRFDN